MQGFRRAAVHIVLVALLLRAFLPAGWMPGAPGEAPLVMCSIGAVHESADGQSLDKKEPSKQDNGADSACAFAAAPALAAADIVIFQAPVLLGIDRSDDSVLPARDLSPRQIRPAPRAPPTLI